MIGKHGTFAAVWGAVLWAALAAPASADTNIDVGLLARWQFTADRLNGQTFAPLAGNGSATAARPVQFAREKPKALRLVVNKKADLSQRVTARLAAPAKLPTAAITVEAWVLVDGARRPGCIVGVLSPGAPSAGWELGKAESGFRFALSAGKGGRVTQVTAPTDLRQGYWYHVVGTYDGSAQRLYVDGRCVSSAAAPSGAIAYPADRTITVGFAPGVKDRWPISGQIERVSIWSRALSSGEVRSLFDARKGAFPYAEPEAPEPVTDWPTYRRDNRRSARTAEALALPLRLAWVHKPRRAPDPAWPPPAPADHWHRIPKLEPRVIYDRAFHAVTVGDKVLFGSSSEDKVVCLDARTGRTVWQFFTEAPVRVAPAIAGGRAVVGSDDGTLYCLSIDGGRALWSHRPAGASDRRIPGNERIISLVPYRTGAVIDGTHVLALAGLFPMQGVFQERLDLATGKVLSAEEITVSPQGYPSLVLGALATPTGRARKGAVLAKAQRRGKIPGPAKARPATPYAAISAGNVEFGGGEGVVAAFDANAPDAPAKWTAKVEGRAYGLAAARGRLLVSTSTGAIYCFEEEKPDHKGTGPRRTEETPRHRSNGAVVEAASPTPVSRENDALRERLVAAAERIVGQADGPRGYCLLLGDDAVYLAAELAKRTEWRLVCRIPDADRAAEAHRALDAAALRGARVAVHHGPLDALPYADGLFNMVVDVSGATGAKVAARRAEALRVTRPGSLAVLGDGEAGVVRAPRPQNAGTWTHTYGDVGNTACSGEANVAGKLALRWFGLPGPAEILDRHHRPTPPLARDGRIFVPGDRVVFGVDAHNGTILWRTEVAGTRRLGVFLDCGSMCLDERGLYVADPTRCVVLDVRTGRITRTMPLPAKFAAGPAGPLHWGYIARTRGLLVGSACLPSAAYREVSRQADNELWYDNMKTVTSRGLFAIGAADGTCCWTYVPNQAVIVNTTIALGGRRMYFVESRSPSAVADKTGRIVTRAFQEGENFLVALDLATGREAWRHEVSMADCDMIAYLNVADETLILSGNRYVEGKLWYFLRAIRADSGRDTWRASHNSGYGKGGSHGEQNRHPVIVGGTVFSWPVRYELASGKLIEGWLFRRGGHGCGNVSASATSLFWRGKNPYRRDLFPPGEAEPINAVSRPGCFINTLPVDGLVVIPEGSSGCSCDFPIQASFGYAPARERPQEGFTQRRDERGVNKDKRR